MAENQQVEIGIEERRGAILEKLNRNGSVKVTDLSRAFGISEVTVRSDLVDLEASGLLLRVHGGAVTTGKTYFNMTQAERMKINESEKRRIAQAAAAMVSDSDTLILSSGTTPLYLLRELKARRNLTIITNSVPAAQEAEGQNLHVILLGGEFSAQYQITSGSDTIAHLRQFRAEKLFLSADGFDAEEGITTHLHMDAELNRQMIDRAGRTIALADYTKIGRTRLARIGDIELIDCLISDSNAGAAAVEAIRGKGVEVILA